MKNPTEYEQKKMSKSLPLQRYQYAIPLILANKKVVLLEKEKNTFAISKFEGRPMIAFWPHESYAEKNIVGDWADFRPKIVTMEDLEPLLDYIEDESWLIDMFPEAGHTGYMVTVEEFIRDLNEAFESDL